MAFLDARVHNLFKAHIPWVRALPDKAYLHSVATLSGLSICSAPIEPRHSRGSPQAGMIPHQF